jgi:cytidylate kinase
MNTPVMLERTPAYFNSQWRESRGPFPDRAKGPFVTISRQSGSGGASLARILARRLNGQSGEEVSWNVFEGNLTTRMLRSHQLPAYFARFLPEDKVSEINASIGEIVGLHPSLYELVQKTNETMRELAQNGNVILVGRGANFATSDLKTGIHVRLVAPEQHRARYLAQLYNMSEKEAFSFNVKRDAARDRYVKSTFGANVKDSAEYDLVINTARLSLPQAAELIIAQVHARAKAMA